MLVIAMLMGCGPSWDAYVAGVAEAACDHNAVCADAPDDECVDAAVEAFPADEPDDYDAQQAAECLRAYRADDCSEEQWASIREACAGVASY